MTKKERTAMIFFANSIAREYYKKGKEEQGNNMAVDGDPLWGLSKNIQREFNELFFKDRINELRKQTGLGIFEVERAISEMPDGSLEEQIGFIQTHSKKF